MRGTYFYGSQGPLLILNLKHVPTKSGVAYNFNLANFSLGRRGEAQEHLGPQGLTPGPDPQNHRLIPPPSVRECPLQIWPESLQWLRLL